MTGRTHDLTALTALNLFIATQPLPSMSIATALVAFAAGMIGGIAPDADQPTGELWDKLPAGSILSKVAKPFIGAHRHISHSILGMILVGFLSHFLLQLAKAVLLVDMHIVWWAFMIGYFSHLVADSLTTDGVPWLLPIPWKIGFPPVTFLRIKTGGIIEKSIVYPGLILANGYLVYRFYPVYISLMQSFIH